MCKLRIAKLLLKCLLGALPALLLILYTAFCPMYYMDGEYPMWKAQKDQIRSGEQNFSLLILGDSRVKAALIPEVLSDGAYSLALGGASPCLMFYTMETYLQNHQAPETVLMTFTPAHFTYETFWSRAIYYHQLSVSQEAEIFETARRFDASLYCRDHYFRDWMSYRLRLPNQYVTPLLNSGFTGRYSKNTAIYEDIMKNRGHTYFGTADSCDQPFAETQKQHFEHDPIFDDYLDRLIELLLERDVTVIVEQTPINRASSEILSPVVLAEIEQYYSALRQKFPSVRVQTKPYVYDNDHFGDNSHLNQKGAETYSAWIKQKYHF